MQKQANYYEDMIDHEEEDYDEKDNINQHEEYDEKENMIQQEGIETGAKSAKLDTAAVRAEEDEHAIHVSHYWPHGAGTGAPVGPQDKSLLYLYSCEVNEYPECKMCHGCFNEMTRIYRYSHKNAEKCVALEDHPRELHNFIAEIDSSTSYQIDVRVALRSVGCPNKGACYKTLTVSKSPVIKEFSFKNRISFYLKVDEASIPLIPTAINDPEQLHTGLVNRYTSGNFVGLEPRRNELSDTFDFPAVEIPKGFKLDLRDYQKRSISWMNSIEAVESNDSNTIYYNFVPEVKEYPIKFKLGDTPYYLGKHCVEGGDISTAKTERSEPLRFYGGILADDTGSGKTITMLGLIHSAPFNTDKQIVRNKRFKDKIANCIESRASCIVCPSNIYKQWLGEARKCNPKFKLYGLSNIHDHQKISWKDLMEADLVVVSYQFLVNSNYEKIQKGFVSVAEELAGHREDKGRIILEKVHFQRIILDEFHELSESKSSIQKMAQLLYGDYFWGLTGTPKANSLADIDYLSPPKRLCDVARNDQVARREIIRKHVKRNS